MSWLEGKRKAGREDHTVEPLCVSSVLQAQGDQSLSPRDPPWGLVLISDQRPRPQRSTVLGSGRHGPDDAELGRVPEA